MSRDNDVKISNFVAKTTLSDSDFLSLISNGQNFKISLGNLKTVLGAIGELSSIGDATGIAVLKASGSDYEIRKILGGAGVLASLSAGDGVEIKHNFVPDTTGNPILINESNATPDIVSLVNGSGVKSTVSGKTLQLDHNFTQNAVGTALVNNLSATAPEFKSLVGGVGINITNVGGVITLTYSGVPSASKTVVVYQESDFPADVAGVITLEADTMYFIAADISTAHRFVLQDDTVVAGSDGTLVELEYTGSGTMITSINDSNKIRDLICTCTSGTLFDVSGTGVDEIFQVLNCRLTCATIGTIDTMYTVNFDTNLVNATVGGFTFLNNTSIIAFNRNIGTVQAGIFINLGTSTFTGFSLTNGFGVLSAGVTMISGMADSGNVNAGGLASMLNTRAFGSGTALNGITSKDALWDFQGNSGIPDSRDSYLGTNAGTTVTIASTNTPVVIGSTWVNEEESRFSGSVGGRFTYSGVGAYINITASITAEISTATDECTFYVYKNGIIEANSAISRELSAGNPGNLSLVWGLDVVDGDYLELFAENNDTTVNIVVNNAIVRIN